MTDPELPADPFDIPIGPRFTPEQSLKKAAAEIARLRLALLACGCPACLEAAGHPVGCDELFHLKTLAAS